MASICASALICAALGENILLTGEGLRPNTPTEICFQISSRYDDLIGRKQHENARPKHGR